VDDINPFLMAHPGIRISIEEGRTHDILVAVNSGKADIGIVVPKLSSERLHFQEYREEEVVFIVSQDHPLATHEEASLMDVLSHPIVTLGPSSPMHACISDKAAAVGRTLNVRAHVTNFRALVQMARAANVVGIVPLSVLKDVVHDDLRIIKTADIWPRGRMQVCIDQSSVGTNHAAWLLFKHLRECAIHAS
jgi:DNA-binding transcriptional LysR family regulator